MLLIVVVLLLLLQIFLLVSVVRLLRSQEREIKGLRALLQDEEELPSTQGAVTEETPSVSSTAGFGLMSPPLLLGQLMRTVMGSAPTPRPPPVVEEIDEEDDLPPQALPSLPQSQSHPPPELPTVPPPQPRDQASSPPRQAPPLPHPVAVVTGE